MHPVTGAILYNLVTCPQRVALDAFADQSKRDPVSPFVKLLWERGTLFERDTITGLTIPFLDLSKLQGAEKEHETLAAMQRGESLIYGGRISSADVLQACAL